MISSGATPSTPGHLWYQLDVSSFFRSSSMSPIRLSKMNWANSSSSSSVILSTDFFGLKYFFLGFFSVMMSPWCCGRRDEHHWFCARSAASPLREAPWLGCSVADTSIEVSLDAVARLGEGCATKVGSIIWCVTIDRGQHHFTPPRFHRRG